MVRVRLYFSFVFGVILVQMGVCSQLTPEVNQLQINQITALLSYMNFSVNPCDDFYEFVCGNWGKLNPIPEHEELWDVRLSVGKREADEIQKIVESPFDETESGHAIQKAKDFYASCINVTKIRERGTGPLLDFLIKLGGWPAIDEKWTEDGKDWIILLAETRRLDQRLIFDSFVFNDIFNKSRNSLFIQFSYMGLSSRHSFLDGGKELNAYKTLINDVLNFFKIGDHLTSVGEIVDFETELARIVLDANELGTLITEGQNITTIGELEKNFPDIDWMKYFAHVHKQNLSSSEQVLVMTWDYLTKLNDLIKRTPSRAIFNFLMWKIVYSARESIGEEFENIFLKFNVEVKGVQNLIPLRERCAKSTLQNFPNAIGFAYVKARFNKTARENAKHLLSLMKESFQKFFENVQWIDEISRDAALLKLKKMKIAIGYPDFVLDPVKVDEFYETVHTNKTTYFENFLNVQRLQNHLQTVLIGKEVDNGIFPASFLIMNAYQYYPKQTIFANAPIFQPPAYHKDFPKFMNFGGIATIISHEISHGFDPIGMMFDSDGVARNWFENSSMKMYELRETCFIEKYGNYSWNGNYLDGKKILEEAIADDAGIKASYFAYKRWLQENTDEIILEDERVTKYDLTPEKMFFISAAQMHCTAVRPEAWPQLLKKTKHALRQFRVNGFISNFESFSEVFKCPSESAMNPPQRCAIW